jgi:lincosamide nucleotidyltransferase A/C/D/E
MKKSIEFKVMMTAENVIEILKMAERINITLWIDGGWGGDALVKQQTRQHNDVDIVIEQKNAKWFIKELTLNGYSEEKKNIQLLHIVFGKQQIIALWI